MNLSLNEVEGLAKRAARGAGHHWGPAEDAAKATRWLCRQGFDGAAALSAVLRQEFALRFDAHTPRDLGANWRAQGQMCPLGAGMLLSDCSEHLGRGPIVLHDVAVPLFLVPFAGNAARRLQTNVTVVCDELSATTDGEVVDAPDLWPESATKVIVRIGGTPEKLRAKQTRALPAPAALAFLNTLAQRTYAPATEESRRLGAGAGLSDND